MAVDPDPYHAVHWQGARLSARVASARARDTRRRRAALVDLALDDDGRLSERIRLTVIARLHDLVEGVARDLRHQAALYMEGEVAWRSPVAATVERLRRAGLLADPELVTELVAQLRQRLLADALPTEALASDGTSLLVRLADAPDPNVSDAARAVLLAEGASRAAGQGSVAPCLPEALHRQLVWTVAAALRDGDDPTLDRALTLAADHLLAAQAGEIRPDVAACRLAAAIDARAGELPDLLVESLSDRQLGLFIAFLARGTGIDDADMRDIVLEPEGDRLWLVLRALDMNRATLGRIGLALSEADGARDIEGFADALDAIMTVTAEDARRALAPLTLPRGFRDAIDRLDGAVRR